MARADRCYGDRWVKVIGRGNDNQIETRLPLGIHVPLPEPKHRPLLDDFFAAPRTA